MSNIHYQAPLAAVATSIESHFIYVSTSTQRSDLNPNAAVFLSVPEPTANYKNDARKLFLTQCVLLYRL